MKIWIKYLIASFSLLTTLILALVLVRWDEPISFYSVIWEYLTVRLYVLISISTFVILNVFKLIESLITKESPFHWARNTKALYGYLLGTFIYFTIGLFVFDWQARVLGLVIPIALTNLGFNLKLSKMTKEMSQRKVLIMTNIVLLAFWSMTTIYLTIDLKFKKRHIEEAKENIKRIDAKFLQRADSLRAVFNRNKGFDIEQLNNKTLQSLLIGQLELHQEFKEFRDINEYTETTHADYLWNYSQMITMLQAGLLMVILLNSLYLIYLIRDSKGNYSQQSS